MGKLGNSLLVAAVAVLLAGISTVPAAADTVVGDRIDVTGVTGHADGSHTFSVSYRCAPASTYADLWIKTRQLDGLHQVKVFGHGALGAAPACTGLTRTVDIPVSAIDATQWLTGGTQHFWAFFCDALTADGCRVDTTNDATVNGERLVLGGKGGVPPSVPDDLVILSRVDHTTGAVTGTYVCPPGAVHTGLGGQIFQDQGVLNPVRVDFSWAFATHPVCDGATHSFTATAQPDVAGHTLTTARATSSAAFVVVTDQLLRLDATGSNMSISQNGSNYASAPLSAV